MKITLIGASGFVGTRLISLLKESNNYQLTNIDKQQSHFFPQLTTIGDVRDPGTLGKALCKADLVILLAAEHRDDISPTNLYYDVNVEGMRNVLHAMEQNGVKRLIFTSSVAIYGLNKNKPDENHPADPFNHYGKSKWQAEEVLQQWYASHSDWNINILRPTVIFGERNRGNVYNLLRQISGGRFLMVGRGENKKSMAYVGNIVAFIQFLIDEKTEGYNIYNYVDKPDFSMNELVALVSRVLGRHIPSIHIPYWIGMCGGLVFDLLAKISRKKLPISSVRVRKFCATTQFDAMKIQQSGFKVPYTLEEGLSKTLRFEFIDPPQDNDYIKSK
ncbi:NAD-dependent epimerase/dehydratase family protein [Alistipes ihumii]|jgi:nucleoside-diphosphate-sugar epimerase|uniref:NAD-dependent epimerase/dehydratase family protein n=1 Tax=Alistipes ihumii TaxID=1470347 RepID=UPI001D3B17B8|nr:NAD-dependent epimerase/dehydratase family protein [Alistipes ihumii]HJG75932.1 NAD-dependent epimerase/dehydratase family protein [Alistipes ihumii]